MARPIECTKYFSDFVSQMSTTQIYITVGRKIIKTWILFTSCNLWQSNNFIIFVVIFASTFICFPFRQLSCYMVYRFSIIRQLCSFHSIFSDFINVFCPFSAVDSTHLLMLSSSQIYNLATSSFCEVILKYCSVKSSSPPLNSYLFVIT